MSIFNSKVLDSWRVAAIPGDCATHVFAKSPGFKEWCQWWCWFRRPWWLNRWELGTIGNHWEPLGTIGNHWEPLGTIGTMADAARVTPSDPKWPQVTPSDQVLTPSDQVPWGKQWDLPKSFLQADIMLCQRVVSDGTFPQLMSFWTLSFGGCSTKG